MGVVDSGTPPSQPSSCWDRSCLLSVYQEPAWVALRVTMLGFSDGNIESCYRDVVWASWCWHVRGGGVKASFTLCMTDVMPSAPLLSSQECQASLIVVISR